MYNRRKYYSIISMVLIIISFIGAFLVNKNGSYTNANLIEIDENIYNEEINNNNENLNLPSEDATAYERLDFAFNILENGAGYTSYVSQVLSVAGQTQNVIIKRYRGNTYDLTEEFYKYDGLFSIGKNEFASYFSDGINIKSKRFSDTSQFDYKSTKYNYDAEKNNIRNTTVQEWEKNQLKLNSFFTSITENNSTIISYDKKARGKSYYTIKLSINPQKLDEKFIKLILSFGISNLKIISINMELKINKNTGCLLSYAANAVFQATYGITATINYDFKETYTKMNVSAEQEIRNIVNKSFDVII